MVACCVSGQGAGVATAVSIRQGKSTNALEIGGVQEELWRQGVNIGGPKATAAAAGRAAKSAAGASLLMNSFFYYKKMTMRVASWVLFFFVLL